ncbi:MAG: response regulator transcription factor [Lachnospiraceae bacterium]|nr:response regulator transcription factor [Lachnospiraceae bacterium]
MAKKILVVDDEAIIVKGLKFSLEQEGYEVECAYDGVTGAEMAESTDYDLILLDVMLPELSGYEVCQRIRENSDVPVIMLTAKSEDIDKIMGLEYGADDYITKPFNILEVKARIKAIFRRNAKKETSVKNNSTVTTFGDMSIDTVRRSVKIGDDEINLTTREFDLLVFLTKNPEKIYSREELLKEVWDSDSAGDLRTVDVHVRRLREKIEKNPANPEYVHTKWGMGYYFKH